jgi:TetR/AcrR family transcriptional repressor of lmrAB and yxaGH operons
MAAYSAALLAEVEDPVAAIDYLLTRLIEYTQSSHYCGGAPLAAVALETAASNERLRQTCEQAYTDLRQPYVDKLLAGGYPPARAETLATLILSAIEGAVILSRTQRSPQPLEAIRTEVRALLTHARQP